MNVSKKIEGLNAELDAFPFPLLRALVVAHREAGNEKLAAGYAWLALWQKQPDEYRCWSHDIADRWGKAIPNPEDLPPLNHGRFSLSPAFDSLSLAYEYAANHVGNYLMNKGKREAQ